MLLKKFFITVSIFTLLIGLPSITRASNSIVIYQKQDILRQTREPVYLKLIGQTEFDDTMSKPKAKRYITKQENETGSRSTRPFQGTVLDKIWVTLVHAIGPEVTIYVANQYVPLEEVAFTVNGYRDINKDALSEYEKKRLERINRGEEPTLWSDLKDRVTSIPLGKTTLVALSSLALIISWWYA